ncbi:glycine zipper 2TM domain-containing protein [Pollutimonas harenae]|uniref:Glycine zipper 2TM domain-containing protein n=1 Tax=Pollutimonas harenae TaxID=657015 RepID=A0A853GWF3_9BURK|nr:glycine zipper 2TM domain-containing protein [Pollutimonas harenae]NYT84080.1 glycine zipper 2TM domain-containing protein [Pollutimonas harenae]TEA73495.1 glycine zipper 2TM domain-containing protein [Pollutimonas harenae]
MSSFHFSPAGGRPARLLVMAALAGSLAVLAGCANDTASSSVYTFDQAQREQIVRLGTVESVRSITIQQDRSSGAGALAGGALGGVAASTIGGGTGQVLATIGGGILGAMAGNAVENQMGRTQGLEITVRLDNGETRVIAQAADVAISAGQRVRLISGNGPTRVAPM